MPGRDVCIQCLPEWRKALQELEFDTAEEWWSAQHFSWAVFA